MAKIYEWTCKECGKKISSLYKNQFEYNKKLHKQKHQKKRKKRKEF